MRPWWEVGRRLLWPITYGVFRMDRRGVANVPREGATLIVCNHLSTVDPPLVGMAAQPRFMNFMAKSELFRRKPASTILLGVGAFPVDRGAGDRDAIRYSRDLLARGEGLIMFPEGTRSRTGRLRPFFSGAGMLALEPGVTVVPAAIWGTQRRFGKVRVVFGPPIDLGDITEGSRSMRARTATRRMAEAVAALVPLAGGPPQTVPEGEPSLDPD